MIRESGSKHIFWGLQSIQYEIIRKTDPWNKYSLKPHFYLEELGFAGVYLVFLFLIQNIHCGYS